MAKRCIGVDIGSDFLRAVQIVVTTEGYRVEKVFGTATRRASDSMPDILRCLFSRHGFDKRAEVAVSMPQDAVFFRNIQTEFSGLEQIHRRDPNALVDSFPIAPEDIVAQVCSSYELPDDKYSVFTAAVKRASLEEVRQTLDKAHINYRIIAAPVFGMLCGIDASHPELTQGRSLVVHLDGACLTLAVMSKTDVVMVRNIPIAFPSEGQGDFVENSLAESILAEARITWQKAFGSPIDADSQIFLLVDPSEHDLVKSLVEAKLNCRVTNVEAPACVEASTGTEGAFSYYVAAGLALRMISPGNIAGINFLDADKDVAAPPVNIKKEIAAYSALAGAFVLLLIVGLFAQRSRLEGAYADVKGRMQDTFTTALPDEKNIVSPLAQMEQKLESLRKDSRLSGSFGSHAMGPLQVLRTISLIAPEQAKLVVDSILITGDSVRIVGTCDSFESVYQWQQMLQEVPGFARVDVKDPQRQAKSGLVQFTVLISFEEQEQK